MEKYAKNKPNLCKEVKKGRDEMNESA